LSKPSVIAIVDDDEAVRHATSRLLRSLGYRTETFASAEAFLSSPAQANWSCLITDLKMPGLSGLDLQAHLRARGNQRPVIFMTAYWDLGTEALALAGGAFAFLGKPCQETLLAGCVEAALRRDLVSPA
jgi:FixJ family two-component response regulator